MSILANEYVGEANDFVEGTISLNSASKWRCLTHEVTVKAGQDCAFCVWDRLGPVGFERWAAKHTRK